MALTQREPERLRNRIALLYRVDEAPLRSAHGASALAKVLEYRRHRDGLLHFDCYCDVRAFWTSFWTYSGHILDMRLSRPESKSLLWEDAMDGRLARYLLQGEGIGLEFKRCGNQLGADVFETICSFASRQGGSHHR